MTSTDTLVRASDAGTDDAPVIAQYLVTKITFWGSYRRILTITPTHIALYDPDNFQCTHQWFLSIITDIEIESEPDHFVLVFEKVRFHVNKMRFHCPARGHLIALLHKLRRQYSFLPLRVNDYDASRRQEFFQCSEHYGDDSYDYFLLQVGLTGVTLLDDQGHKVARFPYLAIQRIAASSAHPDGLVISTLFQERLFLCNPRNECIDHMCAAAQALGLTLTVGDSPLNMQLLRLRNSQALDNPAVVCFDVVKSIDDGSVEQRIQLIFQGVAMIEVHKRLRTIVTRPYSMLLTVVLSLWDADTVELEFIQGETLVVRVESRDQFVALLLLVCRESGNEHVELQHAATKKNRRFHPHITEHVRETVGTSMESFFLRRILHVLPHDEPLFRTAAQLSDFGGVTHDHLGTKARRQGKGGRPQHQRRRGLRSNAVIIEVGLSPDTGATLNDRISATTALEELNANVPLSGFSDSCDRGLLDGAIDALVQHLISQVAYLRTYVDASAGDIVTTLQALTRVAQSRNAFFPEDMVPSLFDALHEIVSRNHYLMSYWTLKLLQRYFEPRKSPEARLHQAKALENLLENHALLLTILDLIPTASSLSRSSSGRWVRPGSESFRHSRDDDSEAYLDQDLDRTLLFTKEERLEKDMNIVTYEALFTLHHVLIFLLIKERQDSETVASILSKTKLIELQRAAKTTDWASTIDLNNSEYDVALHENNLSVTSAAKREIGEKLLSKYKFLMDSVVDVRLARSCQTIVALINFLVNFFRHELELNEKAPRAPPGGFVLSEDERADPDGTVLYQVGSDTEYRRKRGTIPLRRSFLDEPASEYSESDSEIKLQERKLKELFAFLECYEADVATLDNRSRLFPEQNTILIPLLSFSRHASSTDSSSGDSIFYVSGISAELARVREREENLLTLDQLEFDQEQQEQDSHEWVDPRSRARISVDARTGRRNSRGSYRQAKASLLHPSNSTESSEFSIVDSLPTTGRSILTPRFMLTSNFRRLDDARAGTTARRNEQLMHRYERQRSRDESQSDRDLGLPPKHTNEPRRRTSRARPASIAVDDRISAHTCDACIACNDVCESKNCFFCAEKEYQLQMAFSASSVPRSNGSATLSSSLNSDRKYSSCEVRRHQSVRSCWIIVFGFVYDVTDLLSSHPGGMDVLLTAAAVGKDMGELFVKKHPPHARRVLENYYLGEYYHCENRTLLV